MDETLLNSRKEIEPLLPHSGSMVLIDRVVGRGDSSIVTEVTIGSHLPCFSAGRVPVYLAIEVMAQSVAVLNGLTQTGSAKGAPEPTKGAQLGYLLGTRRFQASQSHFIEGTKIRIMAKESIKIGPMAKYYCEVVDAERSEVDKPLASAEINVFLDDIPDGRNV